MGVIKLLECDNCQEETFKKEEPHFRVRAVNKARGEVHKMVLCVKCAKELFDPEPDADTEDAKAPEGVNAAPDATPDEAATPAPAKATAAPAKPTPAKTAQAKAS